MGRPIMGHHARDTISVLNRINPARRYAIQSKSYATDGNHQSYVPYYLIWRCAVNYQVPAENAEATKR